jgi:hypothetical protein
MRHEKPVIMLVYLGNNIPRYVFHNLRLIRKTYPNAEIVFVITKELPNRRKRKAPRGVLTVEYETSMNFYNRTSKYHDIQFRNGFWNYTVERLIAATFVQRKLELNRVLLLEADVLLGVNFPFEEVGSLKNLVWGPYNEYRDVGSIIYFPSIEKAVYLHQQILQYWAEFPWETDMGLLRRISYDNPSKIDFWPTGISEAPNNNNIYLQHSIRPYENQTVKLPGVFDMASIGMWLTGIDPRNNFGLTRYFSKHHIDSGDAFLDPSKFIYFVKGNRMFAYSSVSNKVQELHSLHIHSKRLIFFSKYRFLFLKFLGSIYSKSSHEIRVPSITIIIYLIYKKIRRKIS